MHLSFLPGADADPQECGHDQSEEQNDGDYASVHDECSGKVAATLPPCCSRVKPAEAGIRTLACIWGGLEALESVGENQAGVGSGETIHGAGLRDVQLAIGVFAERGDAEANRH